MTDPKPYSATDTAERESIIVLQNLLDLDFVKPYFEEGDKTPNRDGFVELVNAKQIPIGKLEVQIKSLKPGEIKYPCPSSLVSYSKIAQLPFLFICVDRRNNKAYWQQITPSMTTSKPENTTFTIYFSPDSESISKGGEYLQKWQDIVAKDQEQRSKFPIRATEIEKLTLEHVSREDIQLFQQYLDGINNLIDSDFTAIKEKQYPGIWKFGVEIGSTGKEGALYQISAIPYGNNNQLITKVDRDVLKDSKFADYIISRHSSSKEHLKDPIAVGRKFVFEKVSEFIKRRRFPIYGKNMAADIIIGFIDKYHNCLGIKPGLSQYSVKEVNYALYEYLPGFITSFIELGQISDGAHVAVDLDNIRTLRGYQHKPSAKNRTYHLSINSSEIELEAVWDSVKYLTSNNIDKIDRLFGLPDVKPTESCFIWSVYSKQNQTDSVLGILRFAIDEYRAFVQGNRLNLHQSTYLDDTTAIVFEYEPSKPTKRYEDGPVLREYHIKDAALALSKTQTLARGQNQLPMEFLSNHVEVKIGGNVYQLLLSSVGNASDFFKSTPLTNFIYRILRHDMNQKYNMISL